MSKKTETKATKPKKEKTNEEHLEASMKDVNKILKLHEEGVDNATISSKVRVGESYVDEVISKGAETMEAELRLGYGMPAKTDEVQTPATLDTTPIDSVKETKEEKKARIKKEKEDAKAAKKAEKEAAKAAKAAESKQPKEKRTRENAILKALEESNGTGLTLEAVGTRAREILGIERKSWTGTLGAMKRAGEITYDKEAKLYKLP